MNKRTLLIWHRPRKTQFNTTSNLRPVASSRLVHHSLPTTMKTITFQIGNSDDKLTQREWAAFVEDIDHEINVLAKHVHFCGFSLGDAAWQNACWVFELETARENELKTLVTEHRSRFKQDSVAWTEGQTVFV